MSRTKIVILCCLVPPMLAAMLMPSLADGMGIGSMMVGGLFMTGGLFPGFWRFAETRVGSVLISGLAAYVTHKMMGGHSMAAATAAGWSFLCKSLILSMVRDHGEVEGKKTRKRVTPRRAGL